MNGNHIDMKITKIIQRQIEEIQSVVCDCCNKSFDDPFELQEFVTIDFSGGYGSVFGDGVKVDGDFCQYCVKELLGKYLRKSNE